MRRNLAYHNLLRTPTAPLRMWPWRLVVALKLEENGEKGCNLVVLQLIVGPRCKPRTTRVSGRRVRCTSMVSGGELQDKYAASRKCHVLEDAATLERMAVCGVVAILGLS